MTFNRTNSIDDSVLDEEDSKRRRFMKDAAKFVKNSTFMQHIQSKNI